MASNEPPKDILRNELLLFSALTQNSNSSNGLGSDVQFQAEHRLHAKVNPSDLNEDKMLFTKMTVKNIIQFLNRNPQVHKINKKDPIMHQLLAEREIPRSIIVMDNMIRGANGEIEKKRNFYALYRDFSADEIVLKIIPISEFNMSPNLNSDDTVSSFNLESDESSLEDTLPGLVIDETGSILFFIDKDKRKSELSKTMPSREFDEINEFVKKSHEKGDGKKITLKAGSLAFKWLKVQGFLKIGKKRKNLLNEGDSLAAGMNNLGIKLAQNLERDEWVAIKIIQKGLHTQDITILEILNRLYGCVVIKNKKYIAQKLYHGITMNSFLSRKLGTDFGHPKNTIQKNLLIMLSMTLALKELHEKNVFHADDNTANVIIDAERNSVYIIDFDRSQITQDKSLFAKDKNAYMFRLKEIYDGFNQGYVKAELLKKENKEIRQCLEMLSPKEDDKTNKYNNGANFEVFVERLSDVLKNKFNMENNSSAMTPRVK